MRGSGGGFHISYAHGVQGFERNSSAARKSANDKVGPLRVWGLGFRVWGSGFLELDMSGSILRFGSPRTKCFAFVLY